MRRIFRERFLDVDDMKQRFASKPNRAELYTLFVNGEDWDTYSSLEDVKEVADDIYGKFGKSVKVVDGNGKVVYHPRFKTESRHRRGRMLKETTVKIGLDWLADKIESKTGLVFYNDLGKVDYTGEENPDGLVDYYIANLEFEDEFEYICQYENGDFEVAFWKDGDESPYDSYRNMSPFAVAKYAIENTPFKP